MRIGVVFVSTGGNKMVRALRSFRRAEPDLLAHVAIATLSKVFEKNNREVPSSWFSEQPNVAMKLTSSSAYINGSFNDALKWMKELGYTHACSIHDDVVFSSLPENRGHISEWFTRLESNHELQEASALTLSSMEALVNTGIPGYWQRSPEEWDATDLESEGLWQKLCPHGKPPLYFGSPGSEDGTVLSNWFVKYFVTEKICTLSRLGPAGFIIPISLWEQTGGFDECNGIYYDMEYPVLCALKGFPPVKCIPNVPFVHLHNQSTGFGDPAVGLWSHDLQSFIQKYGKDPGTFLRENCPNGGGY